MTQKKTVKLLVALSVITLIGFIGLKFMSPPPDPLEAVKEVKSDELQVDDRGLSRQSAVIKTVHGNITIKFFPSQAPNTVKRVIQLIEEGFYDGLKFHRVIPDFVLQTGDPDNNGTGGSGKYLKAEFNEIQHVRGTIGMARGQSPDSASSQFYIALDRLPHLDKKYTVFAQVVAGMELLDKIIVGDRVLSFTMRQQ